MNKKFLERNKYLHSYKVFRQAADEQLRVLKLHVYVGLKIYAAPCVLHRLKNDNSAPKINIKLLKSTFNLKPKKKEEEKEIEKISFKVFLRQKFIYIFLSIHKGIFS